LICCRTHYPKPESSRNIPFFGFCPHNLFDRHQIFDELLEIRIKISESSILHYHLALLTNTLSNIFGIGSCIMSFSG
jgi:hypothetical protein